MLGDISGLEKIYIVCGYTDMRKSIDGLSCSRGRTAEAGSCIQFSVSVLWQTPGPDQGLVPRCRWFCTDL